MKSILFVLLILCTTTNVHAKKNRAPSNKFAKKAFTFSCKGENSTNDLLIGITHIYLDPRDVNEGISNTTFYLKRQRDFESYSLRGKYTSVPGGFVLIGKPNSLSDNFKLNIHPNEQTKIPDMPPLNCNITGQMETT